MEKINIKGINKCDLVMALHAGSFNAQASIYFGSNPPLTPGDALAASGQYIDYLNGRVMKVDVSGNDFEPDIYDRDMGDGAAAKIVDLLRD